MTNKINIDQFLKEENLEKLDKLLIDELQLTRAPALSIGVVYENQVILTRNYGAINIEKNIPATSNSLYMIASVTKSFTSLGILKLVEKGKISLDDKLKDYLPIKIGFEEDPIRIKHLLTHTSGIPNMFDPLFEVNMEDIYGVNNEIPKIPWSTWDDIYRVLNDAEEFITEKPGKRFYYNNLAYELLGKIIEIVSNTSFSTFIKKEILNPLKMKTSGFFEQDITDNLNLATPYIIKPGSNPPKLIPIDYPEKKFISAAGGLFSSVNEMTNYMIMHLNEGNFNEKQIIAPELLKQMHSIQFEDKYPNILAKAAFGEYGRTGYGYGLAVHEDFYGHKLVQHSGSYMGASAWMALLPEEKIGVIFLSNHHPSPRSLAQAVLLQIMGLEPKKHHPQLVLRYHHNKLTGMYSAYRGLEKVQVISKNGSLFLKPLSIGTEIPIFPKNDGTPYYKQLNYYTFTEIGGKLPVQFTIDKNNQIWLHFERLKLKKLSENNCN